MTDPKIQAVQDVYEAFGRGTEDTAPTQDLLRRD
jgi:hypothetical protein